MIENNMPKFNYEVPINWLLDRIIHSHSLIAVFKGSKKGFYIGYFYDTVATQAIIRSNKKVFLGAYNSRMPINNIERKLRKS